MESEKGLTAEAIETALDDALIVIQNGGSTSMADRTYNNILKGLKHTGITAIWRLDFVTVCLASGGQFVSITRSVGNIGVNLVRASQAVLLGERAANGEINTGSLVSEINRIRNLTTPYSRVIMIAAASFTCACFTQISKGDFGAFVIVCAAAGIGQFLRLLLIDKKIAVATVTLICGILSACIAAAGIRMGLTYTEPSLLISSVFYMVPGLPLINGFVDMISHKYLFIGLERIANATFLFLVLAIAIAFAITAIL
ncbi:MAG: threonine/serine exporter family protein [Ignavibacteria bacterium]|nr:threonine/serine exporter family protein [Ignavibacteria bacterium]